MKAPDIINHPLAGVVASFFAYLVAFSLVGGFLSHYLFVWFDYAAAAAFSKTILCDIYIVFAILTIAAVFFLHANVLEAVLVGGLLGVAAGGVFCSGYVSLGIPVLVLAIAAVVALVAKLGPIRAAYLGIGLGMTVAFGMFAVGASSVAQIKTLSGVSSSSISTVTNTQWSEMSASQRETFLAYVAAKEAENLGIDNIAIVECILPEDVVATVDEDGRVLINYAAVRVDAPTAKQIQAYIERNRNKEQPADSEDNKKVTWVYESLTSPKYFVVPVCHAVGHVYEELRVDGSLSASSNWSYNDVDGSDGTNATVEEWRTQLPVNPLKDVETSSNSLENQAWNFGYACVGTYVKSE